MKRYNSFIKNDCQDGIEADDLEKAYTGLLIIEDYLPFASIIEGPLMDKIEDVR